MYITLFVKALFIISVNNASTQDRLPHLVDKSNRNLINSILSVESVCLRHTERKLKIKSIRAEKHPTLNFNRSVFRQARLANWRQADLAVV